MSERGSIETALAWLPIGSAIEALAHATGIEREAAWGTIKEAISLGALPAQGFDDRGERTRLEPHWMALTARFQLPGKPRVTGLPMGTLPELLQHTDFPDGGILWFDRRRAAENRLARNITADNRPERSLPPARVRDVVVNRAAIEQLIRPSPTAYRPGPKGGETSIDQIVWEIALNILESLEKPKRGHGFKIALARMVSARLEKNFNHHREPDSIAKSIRASLRDWELNNPTE